MSTDVNVSHSQLVDKSPQHSEFSVNGEEKERTSSQFSFDN